MAEKLEYQEKYENLLAEIEEEDGKTSNRQQLIDYCFRKLGAPVLDINVMMIKLMI